MQISDASKLPEYDALQVRLVPLQLRHLAQPVQGASLELIFRLSLMNKSKRALVLLGRKWTMKEATGMRYLIEGEGVFNQRPVLESGAVFSMAGTLLLRQGVRQIELRLFGRDYRLSPFISPAHSLMLKG